MDRNELRLVLQEVLNERRAISDDEHADHHQFIQNIKPFLESFIAKEKRKQEVWEKVKAQVGGWAIIAVLGGLGASVWQLAKDSLHR